MRKRLVILGATGSVGQSTLDVAAALRDEVEIVGLAAYQNWKALSEAATRFGVRTVAIASDAHYADLKSAVQGGTRVLSGVAGLSELVATTDCNFVLSAIVGAAGLPATLAAVERGIDVGIANKESLVVAGSLLMPLSARTGSTLIPVDSEHSAIFQALHAGRREDVRCIYLTASGGPFREWDAGRIAQATLAEALQHPTWSMGPKITIDSATMMNKALEVIEARWLFDLEPSRIHVIIHPESVVHSMVEFVDGSVIAQLGTPDMKTPIQYALTYPRRCSGIARALDWARATTLRFEPPDFERFPSLRLGFEAAEAGGACGAVLNAANECAVELCRADRLPFGRIVDVTRQVFERRRRIQKPTLEELLAQDAWAREEVMRCLTS